MSSLNPFKRKQTEQDLVWSRPPSRNSSFKLPQVIVTTPEEENRPSSRASARVITFEEPEQATAPSLVQAGNLSVPEIEVTQMSGAPSSTNYRDNPPPYNAGASARLYPSLSLSGLNYTGTPSVHKKSLKNVGSTWTVASAFKSLTNSNGELEDFEQKDSFRARNKIPCNIGLANRKGLSLDKWRCTHHMPETGCMGAFVED